MLVLFLFSFMMYPNMLPDKSFAEPGVDAIPSISITPSNHATLSLNPGVFGSVSQTVTSTTTNYTGYVMTFTTNGSTTNLINTEDDSLVIPTITLPSGESSISPSGFAFNTYGYSLNNSGYKPVPNLNESQEIISTSTANVAADTSTLTFGAIVDFTAIPGSYQNTFLISATANDVGYLISYVANAGVDEVSGMPVPNPEPEPTSGLVVSLSDAEPEREGYRFMGWAEDSEATEPDYAPSDEILLDPETSNITTLYAVWKKLYTIIYVGNDADGGSMSMVSHENVVEGDTIDLYASNFDRTGYGFLGWSFDKNAASTLGTYEQSVIYGPNEQITAPMYVDNEYSVGDNLIMPLFAIWLESSGTIQGWSGCSSLAVGDVIALTDNRDNNTYAIAKLTDGRCWMMENMRLSLNAANITKENTNNPTDYFLTNFASANPTSWGGWGSSYWQYAYNNDNINRSLTPSPTIDNGSNSWYSYGVYYSWMTAMAGNETILSGDICPLGWRFPTASESEIFINRLNGNNGPEKMKDALKYPKNFVLSGIYTYESIENDWPLIYIMQQRGKGALYALSDNRSGGDYSDDGLLLNDYYGGISNDTGYAYRARAAKCFAKEYTTATLIYDTNGGENAPEPTTSAPGTGLFTFTTSSNIPTRTGYTFAGWVDKDGREVSSNSTYTSYQTSATLYAIWTNNSCNTNATTIGTGNASTDAVCLQDMNTTIKNNMAQKETYTLIDARDSEEYTLSLLDDNNVWMTKNLALHYTENRLLTSYDTDLVSGSIYTLQTTKYLNNETHGSFFDWQTSIADSRSDYLTKTISTSICPVGWDLPTSFHFSKLQSEANFNTTNKPSLSPYNFDTGGGFYSGTSQYNSSYSYYWTSSSSNTSAAFGAYNNGSNIQISDSTGTSQTAGAYKTYRRNLRCIANSGTITITYYGNGSTEYPVETPSQAERTVALNDGMIGQNLFTRNHYTFDKWNTMANGSGAQIEVNASVASLNGNYNLYAQWLPNLRIVFHSNDSNQLSQENEVATGKNWKTLKSNVFPSYSGYSKMISWNTEPDGSGTTYDLDTQYTAPTNMTEPSVLNLYAQWLPTYSIVYNGNGSTDGTMDNARQDFISLGDTVNLIASNYSKTGYGFAGWSLNQNAAVNGNYIIYGPNEQLEITSELLTYSVNGIITLYAIWVSPSGTFQTFDMSLYENRPVGTVLALRDERDNNVYAIAKLADGNWWMIENMRLQLTSYGKTIDNKTILGAKSITDNTITRLTALNTDNPKTTFLETDSFADDWKLIGNWSYSSSNYRFTPEDTNQINFGTGNINRQNEASYKFVPTSLEGPHQDKSWYSYGVMYNWFTATAGYGSWGGTGNTNVAGSICPIGWHLPSGTTNGETQTLKSLIDSFSEYPNNIVKSGYYYTGPITYISISQSDYYRASKYRGENDNYYWTSSFASTTEDLSFSYILNTNMNATSTSTAYRVLGAAVRCVATPQTEYTIEYNANGGQDAPSSQTITNNSGIFEHISSNIPTRPGYNFISWTDESGNSYSPNDTLTARNTTTTLYAVWANTICNVNASTINTGDTNTDAVCLQDMNPAIKSSMISKETYTLIDARDQKEYTISKLDDGNVWMTQNLSIGDDNTMLLSYVDTDLKNETFFFLPGNTDTFGTNYTVPQFHASDDYGGYYSWAVAIGDSLNSPTSGTVATSICPSNWDLPSIYQYNNLRSMAGITTVAKMTAAPYNFTTGGRFIGSGISSPSNTYLWTSTPSSTSAYFSNVYQASSYSSYASNYKYYGETIRCVASNGKITIHYDGNGNEQYPVTGSTESQIDIEINTSSTSTNGFRRTGYSFKNWNTKADGSGISVSGRLSNYNFESGTTITLYAQWNPIYTINYYSNNDTLAQRTYTVTTGSTWQTQGPGLFTSQYDNMKIGSWNTEPDGSGTTYNVNSSSTVPPDLTTPDSLNLYAQWVPTYVFTYNGNGADKGNMAGLSHIKASVGNYFYLYASNYSKENYSFAGWSLDKNATVNGNSTIYGPNERVTITNEMIAYNVDSQITFYAIWVPVNGTMQDFDCSTLSANAVVALRDTRDNSVYTVTKLVDNDLNYSECWMSSNLTLNNTYSENGTATPVVLDTNNTHGFGGAFTGLANPETTNFSNITTSNSLYSSTNITNGSIQYRIPRYNNANIIDRSTNPTLTDDRTYSSSTYSLNQNIYQYGNYYSWPAAVANTSDYSASYVDVTTSSICPKGWHLPTGNNTGDYNKLIAFLQNNNIYPTNYPINFVDGGRYSSSATSNRGYYGYYWTASSAGGYAYMFNFYSGNVGQLTYSGTYKYYGQSVRCIADAPAVNQNNAAPASESTTEPDEDDTIETESEEVAKDESPEDNNQEESESNEEENESSADDEQNDSNSSEKELSETD